MEIELKYTKNIDNFIITYLPYIEIYLQEHSKNNLKIHSNEIICCILNHMYGERIITKKQTKYDVNMTDLEDFIKKYYDTNIKLNIKPLNISKNNYLNNKKYVCIFPKFKAGELYHNFKIQMLDTLIDKINFSQMNYDIFTIGNPLEKINSRHGKDIDNIQDIISYLKYCNLFITSESHWKYIALLCNCRNIIVYNSNINKEKHPFDSYNPYNSNIYYTNDITSDETCNIIKQILQNIFITPN